MNVIYDYPKSSCDCYNCQRRIFPVPSGHPTNLSVRSCDVSPGYDCLYSRPLKQEIQPNPGVSYNILNPQVKTNNFSKEFSKHTCDGARDGGCAEVFASQDPRLIDVPRALITTLDRPPIDSSIRLDQIYDDKLYRYGKDYRTYNDIKEGQIMYYVNNSIKDAFFEPVFSKSAKMVSYNYQDPMGAMKPQYDRYPLKCSNPINTKRDHFRGGLSWIDDTQEHRQDLMARQMRKHNEQRWQPRWG